MYPPSAAQMLSDIRRLLPVGSRIGGFGRVVEIRSSAGHAVVLFQWGEDRSTYGIPVPLGDVDTFFGWPDEGVEQRVTDLHITLMEELDTGLVNRACRRLVRDYIELTVPGWPGDERFFEMVVYPDSDDLQDWAPWVQTCGLDPTAALICAQAGSLVTWVLAYENNRQGRPLVGQAVVTGRPGGQAALEVLQLTGDTVPATVAVDLAHLASHFAGETGYCSVQTDLVLPELELIGYRAQEDGTRVVDTRFLEQDLAGAASLLGAALSDNSSWGRDRDWVGRHLPESRVRRWLHRLRYPVSGRAPRPLITFEPGPLE